MSELKIFSGKCCLCDIGMEVGFNDITGRPLHTGDIVIIYAGNHIGKDCETWSDHGLTAVVSDQYQSYSDGSIKVTGNNNPFVMGIKDCGFDSPEWQIKIVKKFSDVIDGEHWPSYGFSYRPVDHSD